MWHIPLIIFILEILPKILNLLLNFLCYKDNHKGQRTAREQQVICVNPPYQRRIYCNIHFLGIPIVHIHFETWRG